MVGWNHENAEWKTKNCLVCNSEFTPKSGAHKFCTPQCKGKWKYVTGSGSTEEQYKKISGNWKRYLSRLLYVGGAKRSSLTVDILLKKLEEQNYKCALSGLPLTCLLDKGKKHPLNVSIDRVNAGGPYEAYNIQLVGQALNCWRSDTDIETFVYLCEAVAKNFQQR